MEQMLKGIDVKTYPSKWNELINKFSIEEAYKLYHKFIRGVSLEKYILKYGEIEGNKKYKEYKLKCKYYSSKQYYLDKYGNEKGLIIWNNKNKKTAGSLQRFIERYGEILGRERYDLFRKRCAVKDYIKNDPNSSYNKREKSTTLEYWIKRTDSIEKAKECLRKRQNTSSLDKLISKYGELGKIKWQEINAKKSNTLENYINKFGVELGNEKYNKLKECLKFGNSKDNLIKKHGEKWYSELLIKKAKRLPYSKLSILIGEYIYNEYNKIFNKIYYGENEYTFYIGNGEFKIIKPDIYIKDINLVIEIYGDYWHKNPEIECYKDNIYDEIRNRDKRRINIIKDKFKSDIIIIWEKELININLVTEQIKNKIKDLLCKK